MGQPQTRPEDPMPGLRRRVRSVGLVAFLITIVYAMVVISDPPIEGIDAWHAWIVLAFALYALTPARRSADATYGTPASHLLRAGIWLAVVASAALNVLRHGEDDTLLLVVAPLTVLAALANAAIRVLLARARY